MRESRMREIRTSGFGRRGNETNRRSLPLSRLARWGAARKTWMPATSAAMTTWRGR